MLYERIQNEVVEELQNLGLHYYGFMEAKKLSEDSLSYFRERAEKNLTTSFEENDLMKKVDLRSEMENAKTIISVAFPYFYDAYIHKDGYFSLYTLGQDYHIVVKEYLEKVAEVIRKNGFEAKVFADNNSLPERYIAYASYVGEIGKNHMLITKEYGSYVFLGEILTDLPMRTRERGYQNIPLHTICGDCTNCIKACPTQILGSEYYDTKRCMSYITQSKEVSDEDLLLFKGRLFGCDTCQRSCPLNRDVNTSHIEAFRPRDYMKYPEPLKLLQLTNKEFLKYKETSSGWRGKKLLQRNAMIELMRKGMAVEAEEIRTEYLLEYYHRLKKLFNL